jgi:hypothetical protein
MSLQTEYDFTLPKGYVDGAGTVHKRGKMRLATARDEIEPLRDGRVQENDAYLTIVILARVITSLGSLTHINPKVIEDLFASDIAYLQDLYGIINFGDPDALKALDDERPFSRPELEELAVGVA